MSRPAWYLYALGCVCVLGVLFDSGVGADEKFLLVGAAAFAGALVAAISGSSARQSARRNRPPRRDD